MTVLCPCTEYLSGLSWPSSTSIYQKSLVFAMCIWLPWTALPGIVLAVQSSWSSWLLVLPLAGYRECAWCECMETCLPTFDVVLTPSSGIRVGCVVPSVVHGHIDIGLCRPCWWRKGRPVGRSYLGVSLSTPVPPSIWSLDAASLRN
jgi:hypothetical protein